MGNFAQNVRALCGGDLAAAPPLPPGQERGIDEEGADVAEKRNAGCFVRADHPSASGAHGGDGYLQRNSIQQRFQLWNLIRTEDQEQQQPIRQQRLAQVNAGAVGECGAFLRDGPEHPYEQSGKGAEHGRRVEHLPGCCEPLDAGHDDAHHQHGRQALLQRGFSAGDP